MSSILQILVALKAADATALTAREAIQSLLGFGDDLLALHRFRLLESAWEGSADERFAGDLERYLDRTVELWNPNRERCWVRLRHDAGPLSFELHAGKGMRAGRFGEPDVSDAGLDHVLVSPLEPAPPVADFPANLGGMRRSGYRAGDLFTTRWRSSGAEPDRADRLHRIAEVRSRHEGLLVHPEFQDDLVIVGALPIPAW
jgi:hypothetical protein